MDSIMTLEEVAAYLRVSDKTVKDWVNRGELPGGKLGTSWRFRREDIERWVKQQLSPKRGVVHDRGYSLQALLRRERIIISDEPTKNDLLNMLIDEAADLPGIINRAQLADAVFSREDLMSTGIGLSVGVPHVRLPGIKDLHLFLAVNGTAITDYESLDGQPVRLVVFILAAERNHREHIQALAAVSRIVKNELVREQLLSASTPDEVYDVLINAEKNYGE